MGICVDVHIDGTKEQVWRVISDIENSPGTISGIEKIEVLEKPESGLVGLKWEETRSLFGRTATEIMWITDAEPGAWYRTRAESHGAVYVSSLALEEENGGTRLAMEFDSQPQTLGTKLMAATIGRLFMKATREAIEQDLRDIKAAVEGS